MSVHPFDRRWFDDHQDALVEIGQQRYPTQGRGVIVVDMNDRYSVGEFSYCYVNADEFITRDPDGLGKKWAHVIRTYDPTDEAVCALVASKAGPFLAFVLVTNEMRKRQLMGPRVH